MIYSLCNKSVLVILFNMPFICILPSIQNMLLFVALICSTAGSVNVWDYYLVAQWSGIQWVFGSEKLERFPFLIKCASYPYIYHVDHEQLWYNLESLSQAILIYTFQAASTWQAINISVPA